MPGLNEILKRLLQSNVEFVLVGGLAAVAHGASTMTQDVDVCLSFKPENIKKVLVALQDIHPTVRAGSGKIPLNEYSVERLAELGNVYVMTDLGELDLLGQIAGLGDYEKVKTAADPISLMGLTCLILSIEALIHVKEAMNRPKDRQVVLELKVIQDKLKEGSV